MTRSTFALLLVLAVALASPAEGAAFGPEESISPGRYLWSPDSLGAPQIAVDGVGNAYFVTTTISTLTGDDQVAIRERCGGGPAAQWKTTAELGEADMTTGLVGLGVASDGTAMVVWFEVSGGGDYLVRSSVRPVAGEWEPPQTISTDATSRIQFAMGANGDAVVAWAADSGNLKAKVRTAVSGTWGTENVFSILTSSIGRFRVAMNASGDALLVAHRNTGAFDDTLDGYYLVAGGPWGPVETVETGLDHVDGLALAFDAAGRAVVALLERFASNLSLTSKWRGSGAAGIWSGATAMATGQTSLGPIALAAHPQGMALTWLEGSPKKLSARRFTSETQSWDTIHSWNPDAGASYGHVTVAVDASGAIVVGAELDESGGGSVVELVQVASLSGTWPGTTTQVSQNSGGSGPYYRQPRAAGGALVIFAWDADDPPIGESAVAIASGAAQRSCLPFIDGFESGDTSRW